MDLKIEYLSRDEIRPYENNAKKHPREQIDQIKKSIQEFGFNDPVAIWKDNVIIEGHGRLLAAAEMGIDKIPVIRLDNLSDTQRKAYALAHNKLTMNSDFDIDTLKLELEDIGTEIDMEDFGFLDVDFSDVIKGEVEEDEYSEEVKSICKPGDLWMLGEHRLVCGDSTNPEVVKKLMGGGAS